MVKKLISHDDEKPGLGLPDVVEVKLDEKYSLDNAPTATPATAGLMPAADKAKLDGLLTTGQLTDLMEEGVIARTAGDFAPAAGAPTYGEATIQLHGMSDVYVRGATQSTNGGGSVPFLTGHRADGSSAVIAQSGAETYGYLGVDTIAAIFDISPEFTSVTARFYNSSHGKYQAEFPPLIVAGMSPARIADFLREYDGTGRSESFPRLRNAWSLSDTYNSATVFTYPGIEIDYSVNAAGTGGAFFEWGKPKERIYATKGPISFDRFGFVGLSTYNSSHSSYDPNFVPYYQVTTPTAEMEAAQVTGTYLPTPTLKAIRQVPFLDGTPKAAIQYLWHDDRNVFYISSSLHGDKKKIFTFDSSKFHGEPVERWSMGFDKYGNILCVFRTEQLSQAVTSDTLRKNPVLIVKDQGYTPQIIDFGAALKPSAWLQDSGYLYTDDYVIVTEYTRWNMETANTWKVTYPISDPANWEVAQSFDVIYPFKHIHMVDRDPYTGHVYTTTGDVDEAAGIYVSVDAGDTFTTLLHGSEKYCRVLNWVFTKDWIYWATDSSGPIHWLFRAPRRADGVMDADNIEDMALFPTDSAPTYATIHMPKIDALLFLNRSDATTTTLAVDLWDLKAGRMVRLDTLNAAGGVAGPIGFRCECFTYVPRGNEVAVGFSNTLGEGGYQHRLGLLGNTTRLDARVQNLIMTVERIPGATEDSFTISYDTSVI